jgi:hypothetical protein
MSGSENAKGEEMMKSLNQAYELLMEYRSRYKYSFKEADIDRAFPDEAYVRRYVYGGLKVCEDKGSHAKSRGYD